MNTDKLEKIINENFEKKEKVSPKSDKKIIKAIKNGEAPDGELLALAGLRSKHNTYMSVPLVWTMHNQHHVTAPTALGIPNEFSWVLPMAMVILGWHIVWQLYKKSGTIKGF